MAERYRRLPLLTLKEASELFGIPPTTLRYHCRQGALQMVAEFDGKSYRVPRDAVVSLAKLLRTRKAALHRMREGRRRDG